MENKNYQDTARQIVEIVGRDNIISATHCATRLRLIVKDKDVIDEKELEKVPFVKGTFFNAGQYQVILGTGIVNKVYAGIEQMNLKTLSKQEQDEIIKKQQKGVKRLMRTLGDIFVPIIPVIAATGLFLGLKGCLFNDNVLALFGANSSMIPNYIVTLVNVLTETAFAFLPAIICWSAFKVFGGTPVIGMVIGLMLVSPILPNALALIMTPFIVMLCSSGLGAALLSVLNIQSNSYGLAVLPDEGKVFAPCEAQVTTVFDTKHAIGLTTKDGVELLIHIGINTVELGGKYYEIHVAEGEQVQPGQLMAAFDITEIQNAGYNMTTPVIVTNTDDYRLVEELAFGTVRFMDPLIRVEN